MKLTPVRLCFLNFISIEIETYDKETLLQMSKDYTMATIRINEMAFWVMKDYCPGLRHHDITFLSIDNIHVCRSLIGISMEEFSQLFDLVKQDLVDLFSHSRLASTESRINVFSSIRVRLFMSLYRLKTGASFRQMEGIFGWSKSSIRENIDFTVSLLHKRLIMYHDNILSTLGPFWQEMELHKFRCVAGDSFQSFVDRVQDRSIQEDANFLGSIGAVDATFCVRPRITDEEYLEQNTDFMYSGYSKVHCYKACVITSHGLVDNKKLILATKIGCGSASDKSLYDLVLHDISPHLIDGAFFLGDGAFHGTRRVLSSYSGSQLHKSRHDFVPRRHFNQDHSRFRIAAENGIGILKSWACFRGRSDTKLFNNPESFVEASKVIVALHNFCMLLNKN